MRDEIIVQRPHNVKMVNPASDQGGLGDCIELASLGIHKNQTEPDEVSPILKEPHAAPRDCVLNQELHLADTQRCA